jgi:hypothetical protein
LVVKEREVRKNKRQDTGKGKQLEVEQDVPTWEPREGAYWDKNVVYSEERARAWLENPGFVLLCQRSEFLRLLYSAYIIPIPVVL